MLALQVRLEEVPTPLGYLRRDDHGVTSFLYDEDYIASGTTLPLSLSLPISSTAYNDFATRAYFGNLIQENDQLDQVLNRHRLGREDIVGLLEHLGADCPGAISCLPLNADPVKVPGNLAEDYENLDQGLLVEIVDRLANKEPLPEAVRDPSPLAGVQNKIAICAHGDGTFSMPKPGLGVPTTHILKVPSIADYNDAKREQISAMLAKSAGLDVVVPDVLSIGAHKTLLIQRFDRRISKNGLVTRIHQEDFMQAAGLPHDLKYERRGNDRLKFNSAVVRSILKKSAQPALAIRNFLLTTFFNLAIGNNDNHGKNHALLYDQGSVPRLAPIYDLLPILLSSEYTHELAFNIGEAKSADEIKNTDIAIFLAQFGLEENRASRFQKEDVAKLLSTVDQAASELIKDNDKNFDDLVGHEISRLSSIMELDLPIRTRDFHAIAGGGWQLS
ncbi:serine/threonine-protein kinase HipA [Parasphingorhabdus marina DSM 22363]|uniref:Serine/threonine-protein kinase HipA n=1 Tax=Parasphingorhabdus marina DSM 22363 TaxID=1123272 RepID=A0A1N6EJH2_9SPHN|nr:HipA domain-containing protein [Parasphingorhabdus marina]SIN83158.1 serine/threonine-protein kinase HipA [Parasphingorhabdus marina DSM 22363]